MGAALAACGSARPAPAPNPVIVNLGARGEAAATSSPATPPIAAAVEQRVSWYGLSLDLGDTWKDATNYGFEGGAGPIEKLTFEPSDLEPAQVSAWLEEVRSRVSGTVGAAYGAKPSIVEPYENATFTVQGVHVRIQAESLYDLFVTLDNRVLGITAQCRVECDTAVRGIVASLRNLQAGAASPAKNAPYRHRVGNLTFDSSQTFEAPRQFMLAERGPNEQTNEHRIFCSRESTAPENSALPSEIHWSLDTQAALAKLPRVEETLTSKPGDAATATTVRLYHREGDVPDELGNIVFASSSSAVIAIDHDVFVCHVRAVPSSPELLARFHQLFKSARREQAAP